MTELILEAGLLLGLSYIEINLNCPLNSEILAEALNEGDSPCFLNLQSLLKSLLETSDLFYLSKTLSLSPYFLLLLKQDPCNSGYCLICDVYYQNLEIHFNLFHKLNRDMYQMYRKQFLSSVEAYFPFRSSKKKLKIKAPLYYSNSRSKTLKVHWKKNAKTPAKPKTSKNSEEIAQVQSKDQILEPSVVPDLTEEVRISAVTVISPIQTKVITASNPNDSEATKAVANPSLPVSDIEKPVEAFPVLMKLDPYSMNPLEKCKPNSKVKQIKEESKENSQDDVFEVQEILEISNSTTSKRKQKQASSETFICDYCFKSISLSTKKSHIYCHKRNEWVQCSDCGDSFKYRNKKWHKDKCLSRYETFEEP